MHDPKDPKLWELWYIPYNGSCRILSIHRMIQAIFLNKGVLGSLGPCNPEKKKWHPGVDQESVKASLYRSVRGCVNSWDGSRKPNTPKLRTYKGSFKGSYKGSIRVFGDFNAPYSLIKGYWALWGATRGQRPLLEECP